MLTATCTPRSFCVAPGAREGSVQIVGAAPALCGGTTAIMPPLRREGGPERNPKPGDRPGHLTVCLPRGGWLRHASLSPIPRLGRIGFVFCPRSFPSALLAALNSDGVQAVFILNLVDNLCDCAFRADLTAQLLRLRRRLAQPIATPADGQENASQPSTPARKGCT